MEKKWIYLDHAATSWPKPPEVQDTVLRCLREAGGNPGRGSHRLASAASELIYSCREQAADFFDCEPERVVFTSGATMGLNLVLHGCLRPGDHVLLDSMAHNAVYRPLHRLAEQGVITYDLYDIGSTPEDALYALLSRKRPETRMVISTHMSNICGRTAPLDVVGQFCRSNHLLFVVDGAQSAGHTRFSLREYGISAMSVPGHKGLLGLQGCGMLLFGDKTPDCTPLLTGGSGSNSLDKEMPPDLPEHLEAGTLPVPAIAGLSAGLGLLLRDSPEAVYADALRAARVFEAECGKIPGLTLYGDTGGTVFSFTLPGILPSRTAAYLDSRGICVRSGYHCAPLAHKAVGSDSTGTVRVSFGYGNTVRDAVRLLEVLDRHARSDHR